MSIIERKYDHIIVDTNNVYYANYYVFNDLTYQIKNSVIITGGVYGSILAFQRLRKRFLKEDGILWALFDNAKSKTNIRKTIDPDYKLDRHKMPKSFYRALDYFRMIQMNHSFNQKIVYETGYESDDIAPVIIRKIPKDQSILVVSEDLDWSRLIDYQGRTVHQYMKKEIFDATAFKKKYEFSPSENKIVLYKVIRGDKVDNIPKGIKGLPTKILLQLIDDFKDIFEVHEQVSIIPYLTDHWKQVIKDNFPRLALNHQLVSFIPLSDTDVDNYISDCKYSPKVLKIFYESLGFKIRGVDERLSNDLRRFDKKLTGNSFDDFWTRPSYPRK